MIAKTGVTYETQELTPLRPARRGCSCCLCADCGPGPGAGHRSCCWRMAGGDGWIARSDLTISNETGALTGAILFYLHRRDKGQPVTALPGILEPIFNLKFDGEILKFQVSHRHAHAPRTSNDLPVSFRLALTGANKGDLVNESESPSGIDSAGSSGPPLVRTDNLRWAAPHGESELRGSMVADSEWTILSIQRSIVLYGSSL